MGLAGWFARSRCGQGGDILDLPSLEGAVRQCQAIFHCAASTALWPPRDPKITTTNLDGTRNVIDAAERQGIERVVYVGTANSYGFGTKDQPGTEVSPYRYGKYRLAYCDSKFKAQGMVLERVREGRIDAVVVNPTYMLGPYDSGPSSGKMILGFLQLALKVCPPGGRNFVHVQDVAAGMVSALERGRSGECYILGHQNMEWKEFFAAMGRVTGVEPPRIVVPKWLILFSGLAGSFTAARSGSPPTLSYEMARVSCVGTYYSPAKAVRELDLPQTSIEAAIEDAYRWFADHGYLSDR